MMMMMMNALQNLLATSLWDPQLPHPPSSPPHHWCSVEKFAKLKATIRRKPILRQAKSKKQSSDRRCMWAAKGWGRGIWLPTERMLNNHQASSERRRYRGKREWESKSSSFLHIHFEKMGGSSVINNFASKMSKNVVVSSDTIVWAKTLLHF